MYVPVGQDDADYQDGKFAFLDFFKGEGGVVLVICTVSWGLLGRDFLW